MQARALAQLYTSSMSMMAFDLKQICILNEYS